MSSAKIADIDSASWVRVACADQSVTLDLLRGSRIKSVHPSSLYGLQPSATPGVDFSTLCTNQLHGMLPDSIKEMTGAQIKVLGTNILELGPTVGVRYFPLSYIDSSTVSSLTSDQLNAIANVPTSNCGMPPTVTNVDGMVQAIQCINAKGRTFENILIGKGVRSPNWSGFSIPCETLNELSDQQFDLLRLRNSYADWMMGYYRQCCKSNGGQTCPEVLGKFTGSTKAGDFYNRAFQPMHF